MGALNFKAKPVKLSIIFLLSFVLSAPTIFPQQASAQTTEYYEKSFAWDYEGRHWTWNLSIPVALYDAYKEVPVSTRTHDGPKGYGFLTTTEDHYVKMLAGKLNETANQMNYGSYDKVSFVLAFVQSLQYTSDNVTAGYNEYPRFPIETLVDDGGDCEDTSILFATLTLIMGYGTVYIHPPDHYAAGILGSGLRGTYWEYPEGSNKTYYYCETTGNNFKIGQLPIEFQEQGVYIYAIDENRQFAPAIVVMPTAEPTQIPVTTESTGPANPTPTSTAQPDVTGPTVQPFMPLSFNLIYESPALFVIIISAIVVSLSLAVWSVRRPKLQSAYEPVPPPTDTKMSESIDSGENKFCIFCGASNKDYAAFCEKCGKQIS